MTESVGLIGWPVAHSVSPAMHNAAFAALGLDWHYDRLPVQPADLIGHVRDLIDLDYRGFNVTVPHKHAIMSAPYIAEVDPVAAEIGAVNTLVVLPGSRLRATNTDWRGFGDDLAAHSVTIRGASCIILGTGGSSKAVGYALRQGGASHIRWVSRQPDGDPNVIGYEILEQAAGQAAPLIVVNCTPVGMNPQDDASPWPAHLPFPGHATFVDLIYNPTRTRLMTLAEAAGAKTIGGLGMLVRQGALAFETWTGIAPPIDVMTHAARAALGIQDTVA